MFFKLSVLFYNCRTLLRHYNWNKNEKNVIFLNSPRKNVLINLLNKLTQRISTNGSATSNELRSLLRGMQQANQRPVFPQNWPIKLARRLCNVLCVQASVSWPVLRQKGEYLLSSTLHKVIRSKTCKISVNKLDLSSSRSCILLVLPLILLSFFLTNFF